MSQLKSFIERIERLNEEKDAIAADVREVKAEAKGSGFDVKVINSIIRKRKMDQHDLAELEEIEALYRKEIGML